MRHILVLSLLAASLSGCKALGLESSLDEQFTAQNLANVRGITTDNEDLIGRAGDKVAPSEASSMRERNTSAGRLAESAVTK